MIVICKSCGKELETDLSSGVVICGNCHESTPITREHIVPEPARRVKCVDSRILSGVGQHLTQDKIYVVMGESDSKYDIKDDSGEVVDYYKTRFIVVDVTFKPKTVTAVHKAFVVSMTGKGYTHEQAIKMFGSVAEYVLCAHNDAYSSGFNNGYAEAVRKVEKGAVVKRDPDKYGKLPITVEENIALSTILCGIFDVTLKPYGIIKQLCFTQNTLWLDDTYGNTYREISNFKAITYIMERFNLVTAK